MNQKILLTFGIAGVAVALAGVGLVTWANNEAGESVAMSAQPEPIAAPMVTPKAVPIANDVAEVETAAARTGTIPYTPGILKETLARGETVMVDYFATW